MVAGDETGVYAWLIHTFPLLQNILVVYELFSSIVRKMVALEERLCLMETRAWLLLACRMQWTMHRFTSYYAPALVYWGHRVNHAPLGRVGRVSHDVRHCKSQLHVLRKCEISGQCLRSSAFAMAFCHDVGT